MCPKCVEYLIRIVLFNPYDQEMGYMLYTTIFPVLLMRKLRERLHKKLAQGHSVKMFLSIPKEISIKAVCFQRVHAPKIYIFLDVSTRLKWVSLLIFIYFQRKQKKTPKHKS